MNERISNLVDVILRMLQEKPDGPVSEGTVRSRLAGEGYKKREIDAAMKLLLPRFGAGRAVVNRQPGSMRSFSVYEEYKLTPEARDALTRLELYELISASDRELVLEHLGQFEGGVGLDELDYLLSWLVCSGRDVEYQQTVANVLDSRRDTLH